MWSGVKLERPLYTFPETTTPTGWSQPDPLQSSLLGETDANEGDFPAVSGEDVSVEQRHFNNGVRRRNLAVRPFTVSASAVAEEGGEEESHTRLVFPFTGEGKFNEESEAVLWRPHSNCQWLNEESDCSQRSVMSCPARPTKTTMQLGDPGAPIKKHCEKKYIYNDADENSSSRVGPALYHHLEFLQESNSVSFPCESSALSHITPLDETGESVDLANHMSHLTVAVSPIQKRLLFTGALDDAADATSGRDAGDDKGVGSGLQLLRREKRFLEEMDTNRDTSNTNSTACTMPREPHRKFRRIDAGENDRKGLDNHFYSRCYKEQ
ncbi:kinesin, putative [Trypanosoma cruzi marinkellei]|uniref:Kinesin, putative n=1 Tax=Trypanosoma cruzi marinkellei TaxID=85056 RepID=K2MN92_TRYCR|nr:kinesin, putative [Trypanosoma cruzi marinkellei]